MIKNKRLRGKIKKLDSELGGVSMKPSTFIKIILSALELKEEGFKSKELK